MRGQLQFMGKALKVQQRGIRIVVQQPGNPVLLPAFTLGLIQGIGVIAGAEAEQHFLSPLVFKRRRPVGQIPGRQLMHRLHGLFIRWRKKSIVQLHVHIGGRGKVTPGKYLLQHRG